MIKSKIPIFFFGLFIVIVSLIILQLTLVELKENTSYPTLSSKGEIDVSNIDFSESHLIGLEGEYEFYWNQLLDPDDFNDSTTKNLTGYINLPNVWNGYLVNNKILGGDGYATFKIRIKFPDEDLYSIKVKEFDCAYKLWVNGISIESGKVGKSKAEEIPNWKRNEILFYTKDKRVDLVFQVSNFNHRKGGPEDLMLLGKSTSIANYKNKQLAITYFLVGLFFIMFIYNYGLYIYRRKEKSYLYFSLICLLILLRQSTTGEKIIYDIFPNINWWIMIRIEYLSYTLVIPLFYMFVRVLIPKYFPLWYEYAINITAALVALIVLFTPVKIFSYTPIFYQGAVALTASFILVGLIRAYINKMEDSMIMLLSYLMLFIISINDILYYDKVLHTAFLMPFGLFIIVFVNAFTLSKRFSNSFATIEELTDELSQNNLELEKKVDMRTKEVLYQKQEIENQAKALQETNKKIINLSKFKDSMTHMIVHDLKNPLNTIINASIMNDIPEKDKIIHEAGREMNNLVLNMLDVYKYENTTMNLSKSDINIKDLVNDATADVHFLGRMRNIRFNVEIHEEIKVFVDKAIIHRVLVNLLTNAIKFSPISGLIEVCTSLGDDNFIQISVKDNGPGIRAERQKTIFERYQSEAQVDSLILSTGLGLNFCKLAVESHGGEIDVESVNMQGSKFTVTLPIAETGVGSLSYVRRSAINQTSDQEILDPSDIAVIQPYINELKKLEVFQVSDILRVLNKFSKTDSCKLQKWVSKVTDAVLLCQQDKYTELINIKNE